MQLSKSLSSLCSCSRTFIDFAFFGQSRAGSYTSLSAVFTAAARQFGTFHVLIPPGRDRRKGKRKEGKNEERKEKRGRIDRTKGRSRDLSPELWRASLHPRWNSSLRTVANRETVSVAFGFFFSLFFSECARFLGTVATPSRVIASSISRRAYIKLHKAIPFSNADCSAVVSMQNAPSSYIVAILCCCTRLSLCDLKVSWS